ncbi:energy-coupling factor transporter transmembrane protein EcfT [Macrococcus sp. DPC7161]|uniref:energy-coupling factor transporter transmembrane component T family protein n=1 Tax=Macrococcus sp. DPC7161 TaxID=2507060 RepID=UPI00100B4A6F|nr:energy-coupling factor transporter transmembrane component T [Macrococcus sp. DPC7161]RXK18441.1 energy-coupling factor transporter transmembrane protein EcfT [Macrococcus sp. DPC7161]
MFELWKVRHTFMDDVNVITKMSLGIALFFFVIFIHRFDYMVYLALLMLMFLYMFSGAKFKVITIFVLITSCFAVMSSLFMIFYGSGQNILFQFGFIKISEESLLRGLHLSLRTMTVSYFGLTIAFTTEVVMVFYSLMQHLKLNPKYAYAFMAAIRMVPIMFESFFQLRNALKMRYAMMDKQHSNAWLRIRHILIPLLSQNIRTSHRLSVAMEKKGFHEGKRTYYYYAPFSYKDIMLVFVLLIMILLSYYLAMNMPISNVADVR